MRAGSASPAGKRSVQQREDLVSGAGFAFAHLSAHTSFVSQHVLRRAIELLILFAAVRHAGC